MIIPRLDDISKKKLGAPLGQPIQPHHLQVYGRTNIKFTKIDDNTIIMDL